MNGRVVGKYKILDKLGEGGMGIVYRAEHVVLGSAAAIKVLLPQLTTDATVVDRFFTEAKAASAIKHIGITDVFDYGQLDDGQAYIVMELLRGEALTSFIQRHGRVDLPLAAEITCQLLGALNAAHVAGVVHRDLKPDNIYLVNAAGAPGGIRVKILDFGIAKLVGDQLGPRTKTKGGSILGTPAYMAPEQCRGGFEVDARADLYAIGCILFEMLTGRPPFVAEGGGEILAMHIYQPAPPLSQYARSVPPELQQLVAKLLTKAPDDRPPSAAWALAALERVPLPPLEGEVVLVRRATPAPLTTDIALELPREPTPMWIPIVVLIIALLGAAAAIYFIGLSGSSELAP